MNKYFLPQETEASFRKYQKHKQKKEKKLQIKSQEHNILLLLTLESVHW